ncbi:GntR family transcriptional regulator [Kitasatospora sp. NPDC002965]|uniref:GntR family transcriptional regulator n=1 Tax=Kitasatospora sp. NPDC002965 TaxID=3154775 RepID=UPI00339E8DBE
MNAANSPKWENLAAELREKIKAGDYAPGDPMPKQADMAAQVGLAESTVRRAYGQLEAEGLLSVRKRRGTIVNDTAKLKRLTSSLMTPGETRGLPADMAAAGIAYSVAATIEDRPAPEAVAELLGVEPGSRTLVRDRIQKGDGLVYQHAATWFLPAISEAIPILREEVTGPGGYLQRFEDLGLTIQQRNVVFPALATLDECKLLNLTAPAAVLRVTRVTRDQNDRVLEVTQIVMTGRNSLVFDS